MTPEYRPPMDPVPDKRAKGSLIVGAYIRVSTIGQFEKDRSTETQLEKCQQEAREMGESLDQRYVWVEVESGAFLERPKLDETRGAVRNRELDILIVYVQDRLSRDMIDPVLIVRECMEAGVRLHFVEGANDTNSLEGQFAMLATGFAAQMEHRQIAERSRRGRERVAREGRRMANGMGGDLYGYDYDPSLKCRVINEKEAVVVRMAFQLAADGVNGHAIASRLNELKIPTKHGKLWGQTGVKRMLLNPAYTGVHFYGMTRSKRVGTKAQIVTPKPAEEWYRIEGFTPPLISQEFFDTVQERRKTPQARWWDGKNRRHLMTGFTRCGKCDGVVTGNMHARGNSYYKCANTMNKPEKPATCDARSIRSDRLETMAWDLVTESVRDPEMISQEILKHTESGSGNIAEEMKKLHKDIVVLEGQESKPLTQFLSDIISQSTLESQAAQVKFALQEKRQSLSMLEEQLRRRKDAAFAKERVAEYCQRFQESLDNLDMEGKRALFAAFGVKVIATRDELQVTLTVNPDATIMEHALSSRRYSYTAILKPKPGEWPWAVPKGTAGEQPEVQGQEKIAADRETRRRAKEQRNLPNVQ